MKGHRSRWMSNLPRWPWAGDIFERMVRNVKGCLRKVLGKDRLTADELYTVLTEIECTLNSRSLIYQYDIGEVLTPSHLILGQRLSPFSFKLSPTVNQLETNAQLSKRFMFLKKKLTHFWNRWKKEYLVNLRECHRMKKNTPNVVEKGEVVLIHEDGAKRLTWKKGIVKNLITGKDGEVRGTSIQGMGKGKPFILNRPVQNVYPLEISDALNFGCVTNESVGTEKKQVVKDKEKAGRDEEKTGGGGMRRDNPRPIRLAANALPGKTPA